MNFLTLLWSWAEKLPPQLQMYFPFLIHTNIPKLLHTENVDSLSAHFSVLRQLSYDASTNEHHSWSWLSVVRVVLCISCFLYAVIDRQHWTWRHTVLQTDCSHCFWSHITLLEPIALSDTNHHVCKVLVLSQNYRFLIYCGESENRGVLMSFKAEHTDSFPGKEKVRRWHVSPQWTEAGTVSSTFHFTFRLNVFFPSSFPVITTEGILMAWWEGWLHFPLIHLVFPLASRLCRRLKDKCW